jgi:transcriptional regulator with XRE-family HTH domain
VRELRTGLKLSQEQLAERADLHWTHISGIERGRHNLKLSTLTQVARAFGVTLSELCAGIGPAKARAAQRRPRRTREL